MYRRLVRLKICYPMPIFLQKPIFILHSLVTKLFFPKSAIAIHWLIAKRFRSHFFAIHLMFARQVFFPKVMILVILLYFFRNQLRHKTLFIMHSMFSSLVIFSKSTMLALAHTHIHRVLIEKKRKITLCLNFLSTS